MLQRAQARLLESLLGAVEVAEVAQQRAHRLGAGGANRPVDPGHVDHGEAMLPASNKRSGRISNEPASPSFMRRATSMTSSSDAQSTM